MEPFEVPGLNVKISHNCHASMIDGKVRKVWSDITNASQNCPICGATPRQMSKPRGEFHNFTPIEGALKFASFGVHAVMRSWDWFNKRRFHDDFRQWSCRDIHVRLYDQQKAGLKADFLQPPFGFKVYQPTNGGSSNTGV